MELLFTGFSNIFNLYTLLMLTAGVLLGITFGAIPGLSATMAIALCLPITFGMDPIVGFSLLIGLYIGGISGGLISATLINIPGTPSSIATTFDGYPMSQKGYANKALGSGILFSFVGGLISIVVLILISPILASFAVKFGPFEYFAVGIFSLTMIMSLIGKSVIKGLISGVIGICLAMVGSAPIDGAERFTFGFSSLSAGFDLLAVLIGLFAVSEVLNTAGNELSINNNVSKFKMKGFGISIKEFVSEWWNALRSAVIGIGIGILPGIGGGTSNLIAYATAKNQSKNPDKYGKGSLSGIVASETANNASIGGALVPLLTLGIPGDTVTALLLGGFMVHGLSPGPLLFVNQANIVYSIFAALLIANFIMLFFQFYGIKVFVKLLSVPKYILLPVILTICAVGAYGVNNRLFDVWTILFFGVIGYILNKNEFPLPPIILGFILSPIIEVNLLEGLMISKGSFIPFITRPISVTFLLISVFSLFFSFYINYKRNKKAVSG